MVCVDDLFPVTQEGTLLFGEPNVHSKNVWGIVLEKVWAYINGNYERTCAGWQHEVLNVFVGIGADDYIVSLLTVDELWEKLSFHYRKGHVIGAGSKGNGDDS